MNEDRPLPEDDATGEPPAGRLADVERRLKRLRPRPVTFDARTIIRAAERPDREASVVGPTRDTVSPRRPAETPSSHRYGGWRAIGASWVCGMVAGALLTLLAINKASDHEAKPDSSANVVDREPNGPSTVDRRRDSAREADSRNARDGNDVDPNDRLATSASNVPVAYPLELLDPVVSLEYRPLRAGNYPRIGRPIGSGRGDRIRATLNHVPHASGDNSTGREPTAISDEARLAEPSTSSSTIDRDALLRELLGNVEE